MQDILASIKRIIAEPATDHAPPHVGDPAADGPVPPDEDVLDLGDGPEPDRQPDYPAGKPQAQSSPVGSEEEQPLLSGAARAASVQAMASLSTIAIDPHAGANTLDGLVRDLLRPMLKEWLDANLPELVERVVAREVARLGGR